MHSKGVVTAFRLKYGPGLKSIVYVHGWNQVAFACNQDKEFTNQVVATAFVKYHILKNMSLQVSQIENFYLRVSHRENVPTVFAINVFHWKMKK